MTHEEAILALEMTIKNIVSLPPDGQHSFVTHMDLAGVIAVIVAALKDEQKKDE